MTALGADPDALDALAVACRSAARRIDEVLRSTSGAIRRAGWEGPDAERFERTWRTSHRVALERCAAVCSDLGRTFDRQAGDQRRASRAEPGPAATGGRSGPRRARGLPVRSDVYSGTLVASVGPVTAGLSGTLVLDDLGGGLVRVSHSSAVGAGPGASAGAAAGATVGSDVATAGAASAVDGQVEGWTTRRWTVTAEEVPALLVALAVESSGLGAPFRAVDVVAQGVDDVLAWVGHDADLGGTASFPGVPDPEHVEQLVGVSGSVVAALGAADPSPLPGRGSTGSAGLVSRVLAGTAADGDRSSVVVEEQAQGSVLLGGALRPVLGLGGLDAPGASARVTTRVEVPLGTGSHDVRPILVTMTSDAGDDRTVARVIVDRTGAGAAGRRFVDALEDLARGDGPGARRGLTGLRLPDGSVRIELDSARLERSSLALPFQVPGASLTPSGSRTTVRRR